MSNTKKKKADKIPKKNSKKLPVTIIIAAVLAASAAAALIIFNMNAPETVENSRWVPVAAKDASSDEPVELSEVYSVYYSNYQGYLEFGGDNSFTLWMSPGDPGDGLHSGKYELGEKEIKLKFDEGTVSTLELERDGGTIKSMMMYYSDYRVYFERTKG